MYESERTEPAEIEMPRYKCHKVVHALYIKEVREQLPEDECEFVIIPGDAGYGAFPVSREFVERHKPEPGGYYVVYEDGYKSYSPGKAFEKGYERIWD